MESWSQLDFDKLDLDGDGVVSKEELATGLACPAWLIWLSELFVDKTCWTSWSSCQQVLAHQDWDTMEEVKGEADS